MIANKKKIISTFLSGRSPTTVIPIDISRRHGLDQPSEVIIEETENGILIRKVKLV